MMNEKENIVSTILPHTKLKKLGTDRFVGYCPFCRADTPTFFVSWKKQSFHCFNCGKSGDEKKFISLIDTEETEEKKNWMLLYPSCYGLPPHFLLAHYQRVKGKRDFNI